jgi:hypothetical protein
MRTSARRAALATLALLAAPVALIVSAAPAGASSWTGVSPAGTVCANDARTIYSAHLTAGQYTDSAVIELRYSPTCRAAWARIVSASAPDPGNSAGGAAAIHRSDGVRYLCTVPSGGSSCFTLMVNDAGFTSRAHGTDDTGFAIFDAWTGWY